MMRAMRSIRRELLVSLLLTMLLALVLAGVAIYRQALWQANELFDFQLQQMALSLPPEAFSSVPGMHDSEGGLVIQIWSRNGVQLYYSHPRAPLPHRAELGFNTISTPQGDWRVYGAVVGHNVVQLAQPMSVRDTLAAALAVRTLLPLVVLVPVLALLVWLIVGRGLRPLRRVTHALDQRAPGALEPLPDTRLPDEVRPLVQALNSLLERLSHALDQQKAFVADAAHELRTPLTALQLQLQILERAGDDEERRGALADLRHGMQRATRLVQQLLTLARQDPEAPSNLQKISLDDVLQTVVASYAPLAEARHIDLGLERAAPDEMQAQVSGDADALRTLFGNLIDNAIKYTPDGGRVDVRLASRRVDVIDTGPGIPADERPRVFDRFYRRTGQTGDGSGLGLAIVKRIAEAHHAAVVLSDGADGRGLCVSVRFAEPAAAPLL